MAKVDSPTSQATSVVTSCPAPVCTFQIAASAMPSAAWEAAMTSPNRWREDRIGSLPVIVTLPPPSASASPTAKHEHDRL